MDETKDIFISHNWGLDCIGTNNHRRCKIIADELILRGYSVWFDDNDMIKNIDTGISEIIRSMLIGLTIENLILRVKN